MEANIETLEPKELELFLELKEELSLPTMQDAVKLIVSILLALRQVLDLQSANKLVNTLPDFLRLVYACNWKRDEPHLEIGNVSEFVALVEERARENGFTIFANGLKVTPIIMYALKKLYKACDEECYEGLHHSLRHALANTPSVVAA